MFTLDAEKEESDFDKLFRFTMEDNEIAAEHHDDLRPLLYALFTSQMTEHEFIVTLFIIMYCVKEASHWRSFLTETNLSMFVNDSVLIMCSEAHFLADNPWMQTSDFFEQFLSFMACKFIDGFQP